MTAWLRWLRAAGGVAPRSTQTEHVEELEVELTLLREENARLKVKRQRAQDRPVHERVRELLPVHRDDEEPQELFTDCLLLRDGLLDACREIELGVRETRQRLEAFSAEDQLTSPRDAPDLPAAPAEVESAA